MFIELNFHQSNC